MRMNNKTFLSTWLSLMAGFFNLQQEKRDNTIRLRKEHRLTPGIDYIELSN